MTSDSPSNGKTPEETPPQEVSENSPQEDDEWDELEAMSRDEEELMRKTVPYIRQREDGMIEIPLPFRVEKPYFPYNRGKALQRTKTTLQKARAARQAQTGLPPAGVGGLTPPRAHGSL